MIPYYFTPDRYRADMPAAIRYMLGSRSSSEDLKQGLGVYFETETVEGDENQSVTRLLSANQPYTKKCPKGKFTYIRTYSIYRD